MDDHKKLFAECGRCGEHWKIATLPAACKALGKLAASIYCPNCGEHKGIGICVTDGPYAVTKPRGGKHRENR